MEIGWTDVGSGGYILVSCAHSNTSSIILWRSVLQVEKTGAREKTTDLPQVTDNLARVGFELTTLVVIRHRLYRYL